MSRINHQVILWIARFLLWNTTGLWQTCHSNANQDKAKTHNVVARSIMIVMVPARRTVISNGKTWNTCIANQLCSFTSQIRTVWDSEGSQTFPSNGTVEISIQKSVNKHVGKTVRISNYISCCWENPNNQMIQYVIKSPLNKSIVLRLCLPRTAWGAPHVFLFSFFQFESILDLILFVFFSWFFFQQRHLQGVVTVWNIITPATILWNIQGMTPSTREGGSVNFGWVNIKYQFTVPTLMGLLFIVEYTYMFQTINIYGIHEMPMCLIKPLFLERGVP